MLYLPSRYGKIQLNTHYVWARYMVWAPARYSINGFRIHGFISYHLDHKRHFHKLFCSQKAISSKLDKQNLANDWVTGSDSRVQNKQQRNKPHRRNVRSAIRFQLDQRNIRARVRSKKSLSISEQSELLEKQFGITQTTHLECQVENGSLRGLLLVDTSRYRHAYLFWLHILRIRTFTNKDDGIKAVWKGLRQRNIDLPIRGPTADAMWTTFIQAGIRDDKFMREIWAYTKQLHKRKSGRTWPKFYESLVGALLMTDPPRALSWHHRIKDDHWVQESAAFFYRHVSNVHLLQKLKSIYDSVKQDRLYGVIIPHLSSQGLFDVAQRWHQLLMHRQDVPYNSAAANVLVAYMVRYQSIAEVQSLLQSFADANVPLVASTLNILISQRSRIKLIIPLLQRFKWALHKDLHDDILATLTSYQELTSDEIDALMKHLEVTDIGSKTVGELAKKQYRFKDFLRGAQIFKAMNYAFDAAMSSRLVQETVRLGVYHSKPEVIEALVGPNFSKLHIQEALLTSYLMYRDWERFDELYRQLDVHTAKTWNLCLRSAILRKSKLALIEILENMRMNRAKPGNRNIPAIANWILPPRRRGFRQQTLSCLDVLFCAKMLKVVVECGGKVSPGIWHEIIKRLGMLGRFNALERLVVWLVESYKARPFVIEVADSESKPTRKIKTETISYDYQNASSLRVMLKNTPGHPLRKILDADVIKAFVHWGFLNNRNHTWSGDFLSKESGVCPPRAEDRSTRAFWGIYLVKALYQMGVHVDEKSIVKAVKLRMRSLFGTRGESARKAVRYSRAHNVLRPVDIIRGTEAIWQSKIFPDLQWDDEEAISGFIGNPKKYSLSRERRIWRYSNLSREARIQLKKSKNTTVSLR